MARVACFPKESFWSAFLPEISQQDADRNALRPEVQAHAGLALLAVLRGERGLPGVERAGGMERLI